MARAAKAIREIVLASIIAEEMVAAVMIWEWGAVLKSFNGPAR
jgi:hypothetical protein